LPAQHRIAKKAEETGLDDARFEAASTAIARGLDWLVSQQAPNGSWMPRAKATPTDEPDKPTSVTIAISALVVKSLAQADSHQEALDRGVDALLRNTGTVHSFALGDEGRLGTYVAAAVCSALASIDDPAVLDRREDAITWLKSEQWASDDGLAPSQDWFGGAGYGTRERPDLSNTQMMLDALHDAGVSPEDPAVQRALIFVSRTQNLARTNDASWSTDGSNDGGFIYTPANGGESMASEYAGEGRRGELIPVGTPRSLRSYGSMTYAGFKSLLYAGLTREDPRVQAAFDWIRAHWTFEENPGLGQQGRFYYLHAAARALAAAQSATITTPDGTAHPWRAELVDAILAEQREDGSWSNEAPRWLEGEPVLATAYALLALEEALKPAIEVEVPPNRPQGDFSRD
jgi:squalene-hopene/tetraprenyl-beta-curcumene cyclase